MLHVWYICQHLPNVGKFSSTMEHIGKSSPFSRPRKLRILWGRKAPSVSWDTCTSRTSATVYISVICCLPGSSAIPMEGKNPSMKEHLLWGCSMKHQALCSICQYDSIWCICKYLDCVYPRCSMYGIFAYIWGLIYLHWAIFGVNVGEYSIHGASGYGCVNILWSFFGL